MRLVPWSKRNDVDFFFSPVVDFRSEVDKLFDNFFGGNLISVEDKVFTPKIELNEDEKSYSVKAELPGLDKEDVKVNLTIKGEKKHEKEGNKNGSYYKETHYGSFCRRIPFQTEVDEGSVNARFKNGVLTLTLPKKEVKEKKSINIDVE